MKMASTVKVIVLRHSDGICQIPRFSMTPSAKPASPAPTYDPTPPTIMATTATRSALTPMVGSMPLSSAVSMAATATSAEPSANATIRTRSVGIPIMRATPGSFSTARIALPMRVPADEDHHAGEHHHGDPHRDQVQRGDGEQPERTCRS